MYKVVYKRITGELNESPKRFNKVSEAQEKGFEFLKLLPKGLYTVEVIPA